MTDSGKFCPNKKFIRACPNLPKMTDSGKKEDPESVGHSGTVKMQDTVMGNADNALSEG